MAVRSKSLSGAKIHVPAKPKKTRQGQSINTHLGASSRNGRKKRYRGQGN